MQSPRNVHVSPLCPSHCLDLWRGSSSSSSSSLPDFFFFFPLDLGEAPVYFEILPHCSSLFIYSLHGVFAPQNTEMLSNHLCLYFQFVLVQIWNKQLRRWNVAKNIYSLCLIFQHFCLTPLTRYRKILHFLQSILFKLNNPN